MRPFDPRLFRTVPEARGPFVLLAAVGTAGGAATIATAFALTGVVVAIARHADLSAPLRWLAVLFVARGILAAITEYAATRAGADVSMALRRHLLAAWSSSAAHDADPARRLTLATAGCTSVEPYVARYLPALISAAVVPVAAIVTLALVDWASALVVVLTLPLLPLFAALIGRTTAEQTKKRWRSLADLAGHFLDVVRGLPTLVNYGRADKQLATIATVSERHRVATMGTLRLAFMSTGALELLATISVAIVAVLNGVRLAHGSMPLQTAMVAILLAPEAYWPIRRLGQEFHSAADGVAALEEITAAIEPPTSPLPAVASGVASALSVARGAETADGTGGAGVASALSVAGGADNADATRAEGAVVIEDLTYTYPGATTPVLDGVSLSAGPGLTAVTGPSGAGKTTLLELISGLRRPDAGNIRASRCHLVTQRPFLPTGPLSRILALGNGSGPEQQWQALRAVGLDGLVSGLPRGLDTVVGDDGFGLSAGQRARIGLARALLAPEHVILLDEPTAHLDDASAATAHRAIAGLAQTRCVIAVTHREELVAEAAAVVEIAGRQVERGDRDGVDATAADRSGVTREVSA